MYFYGMQQWIPLLRCNWRHHTVQGNDPTTCCRCKWIQHAITGHYKRGMIAFWHLVCGKLCLPSQYAEEFVDLSASHAIWLSSDSRAKKSRDLLLRLMVERFTSLLPEIFFFSFLFFHLRLISKYRSLACLWASVLHQNNSVIFWAYCCERQAIDPLVYCLPDGFVQSNWAAFLLFLFFALCVLGKGVLREWDQGNNDENGRVLRMLNRCNFLEELLHIYHTSTPFSLSVWTRS